MAKKSFFGEEIKRSVFISKDQLNDSTLDSVYGYFFEDTGIYNILPNSLNEMGKFLGKVFDDADYRQKGFYGIRIGGQLHFFYDNQELSIESYGLFQSIFSRNSGILESDKMMSKRVVIIGCGSVGSLVSMELARSGVGHFLLIDADIVEYHNICRHQCGIEDVGDLKVNALERRLKKINPSIDVVKVEGILQNTPKPVLDSFCDGRNTVFVGCADNRSADVYANRISIYYSAAFVSIGFWERAFAGEIFYHIPDRSMPCYECALGTGSTLSSRSIANHHIYSNQENVENVVFEPGISVDISFITMIGIKLIIDILCESDKNYTPRLLNDLKQYTLVCNTCNPAIGGEMVEVFSYPLQITTSLVVSFNLERCRNSNTCKYELMRDKDA